MWKWIKEVRAWFLVGGTHDDGALFLNRMGTRASDALVRHRLKYYLELSGIEKEGVSPPLDPAQLCYPPPAKWS